MGCKKGLHGDLGALRKDAAIGQVLWETESEALRLERMRFMGMACRNDTCEGLNEAGEKTKQYSDIVAAEVSTDPTESSQTGITIYYCPI